MRVEKCCYGYNDNYEAKNDQTNVKLASIREKSCRLFKPSQTDNELSDTWRLKTVR